LHWLRILCRPRVAGMSSGHRWSRSLRPFSGEQGEPVVNQSTRSGDVRVLPRRLAACACRLVFSIAALLPASGLAQTPWGPAQWNFPSWNNGSAMFTPLQVFPRQGTSDPGVPNNSCPLERPTGLCMFVDDMGTADPNDDREYYVQCRSDGIFLIDITLDKT